MKHPSLPTLLAVLSLGLAACQKKESGSQSASPAPASAPAPAAQPAATQPPSPAPVPAAPPPPAGVMPVTVPMDFGLKLPCISQPPADFAAFKGRPVVLFYFGPTCPHCQHAFPDVQAYGDGLKARGIETLAIATSRSNPEEILGFARTYQARIPVFWDAERRFGEAFDIKTLPTLFLVGAGGQVHRMDQFAGKASLDSLLARL